MTPVRPDVVNVELDAVELGGPRVVGMLRRNRVDGGSMIGFAYDPSWLDRPDRFALDPLHGLYPGDQWPRDGRIDAIFSDASTDRWGRTLLDRREVVRARQERRHRRRLDEWDYLLGISDVTRTGAIRFRTADGEYLDPSSDVPPMARLPALAAAVRSFERPDRTLDRETHDLAVLIAPGSSLGGARPKATVIDGDGSQWIAKFPSLTDTRDMAACEWALNELAAMAGIEVPEHRLLKIGRGHRTFAARRFDRAGGGRRLYTSAMTMASLRDREPASYLDVALAVADHGAAGSVEAELAALFRRVAFNILTAHRDDHLRNHGFVRANDGWHLAPAFDLNPMPEMTEHELAIDDADHRGDVGSLFATADHYRLRVAEAEAIVGDVRRALASWDAVAKVGGLGTIERDTLAASIEQR